MMSDSGEGDGDDGVLAAAPPPPKKPRLCTAVDDGHRNTSSSDVEDGAEEERPPSPPETQQTQQWRQRLSRDEVSDFVASLEHVIVAGHHAWLTERRYREWREREAAAAAAEKRRRKPSADDSNDECNADGGGERNQGREIPVNAAHPRAAADAMPSPPIPPPPTFASAASYDAAAAEAMAPAISAHSSLGEVDGTFVHGEDARIYRKPLRESLHDHRSKGWPVRRRHRGRRRRRRRKATIATKISWSDPWGCLLDDDDDLPPEALQEDKVRSVKDEIGHDDDAAWDLEYGDGIDPLDFAERRLLPPTPGKRRPCPQDGRGEDKADDDVNDEDDRAVRTMLQQCWERAVHAASCSVSYGISSSASAAVGDGDDAMAKPTGESVDAADGGIRSAATEGTAVEEEEAAAAAAAAAAHRSKDGRWLDIVALAGDGDKEEEEEETSRQRRLVGDVLRQEVMLAIDGVLHVVLEGAMRRQREEENQQRQEQEQEKTSNGSGRAEQVMTRLYDWRDVLGFLRAAPERDATAIAHGATTGRDATDTFEVCPNLVPISLNGDVVRAVSMRLMERYAVMPSMPK